MFALVVRFDCRDEAAEHVRRFHAAEDRLLTRTRVEFLTPGVTEGLGPR